MGTIEVRITTKGKTTYDAAVRRKGCRKTYRSFVRLTDAKLWIQEMEFKIRTGMPCVATEAEQHTLSDKKSRSPNLYPLVILTPSTGMRRSEVTKLTWQQVDLTKGVIILLETKNKEPRQKRWVSSTG